MLTIENSAAAVRYFNWFESPRSTRPDMSREPFRQTPKIASESFRYSKDYQLSLSNLNRSSIHERVLLKNFYCSTCY